MAFWLAPLWLVGLKSGYDAGRARRTGGESRALVPYSRNHPVARVDDDHRAHRPPAAQHERRNDYQHRPQWQGVIRQRVHAPRVRIDTAEGTYWIEDYTSETEWRPE